MDEKAHVIGDQQCCRCTYFSAHLGIDDRHHRALCPARIRRDRAKYGDVVFEPLILREESIPGLLIVVRLGMRTLEDEHLLRSVDQTHGRWGIWGFSVLEVPEGDYHRLALLRPIVSDRRQLLVAEGQQLLDAGFPLLPTLDYPHWTVTLSAPTPDQFAHIRSLFHGPIDNPAYSATTEPIQ